MKKYFVFLPIFAVFALLPFQCVPSKDGGVFISDDFGDTWKQQATITEKKTLASVNVINIAIDPNDSKIVYLGTKGNGLFKSTNGGESWFQPLDKNGVLDKLANVYDIAIDPKNTNRIYIGTYQAKYGQLLRSEDGGQSWERVYIVSQPEYAIFAVEIDSYDSAVVYMGTAEGGLLKSTDYGKSWEIIKWFDTVILDIKINPRDTKVVYVNTFQEGVFKTTDKGTSWESLKEGLAEFTEAEKAESLIIDQQNPNILFIGSEFGLLKSQDSGQSWQRVKIVIPPNSLPVLSVALDPNNSSKVYYGAGSVVYRSQDGGQNWTVHKLLSSRNVKTITVDPRDSGKVYVGLSSE